MADQKISQLTDGTSFQAGDEAVVNRSGTNYKVDPTQFGSSIDVTGTVTADGLTMGADDQIIFGASNVTGIYRTNSGTDFTMQHWGNISMLIDSDNNDANTRQFLIGRNSQDASTALKIALFSENGDLSLYEDTGTTPKFFWDASAEALGIGTTSPAKPLHVSQGANSTATTIRIENTDTTIETAQDVNTIEFYTNDASASGTGVTSEISQVAINAGNQYALTFSTYNVSLSEKMRIDHDGNVGIGTSSPNYPLTISDAGDGIKLEVTDTVDANFRVQVSGSNIITGPSTSSAYIFQTGNTERMRIDSSGNVGIGVSDPAGVLDVASGLQRTRSTNGNGNSYNITKYVAGAGAQTALQITIPAESVFVFIKMTFANSRAPYSTGGVGTSYAGERYFAIARNGSGSDVVLDSNVGTKDWTATTTTAGGATSATSAATTIVRNGAEANTEPQVVNITFNPETTSSSSGAAVLKFEILDLNLVSIA